VCHEAGGYALRSRALPSSTSVARRKVKGWKQGDHGGFLELQAGEFKHAWLPFLVQDIFFLPFFINP